MSRVDGLRLMALAEAATLLLLVFVAVPLKHLADMPLATRIMGPVHGAAFVAFLWFVTRAWSEGRVDGAGALRLFVGATIPFGGIVNERWLRRRAEDGGLR